MLNAEKEDFETLVAFMADFARTLYKEHAEIAPFLFVVRERAAGQREEVGIFPVDAPL